MINPDRLGDVIIHAGVEAYLAITLHRDDARSGFTALADTPPGFGTIHRTSSEIVSAGSPTSSLPTVC